MNADVRTGYGSIRFTAPSAFGGGVHLATSYGNVRGDGPGTLRLETSSGSIVLK